jgi:BON domain
MPEQGGTAPGGHDTTEADRALNQRIWQTLRAEPTLGAIVASVQLRTANGEVTVQGTVATEREKADIAAKVQKVAGVKKVYNQLQMAPRPGGTPGASGSGGAAPSGSTGASAGGDGLGATRSPAGK